MFVLVTDEVEQTKVEKNRVCIISLSASKIF